MREPQFGEPWYWEIRKEDRKVMIFGTRHNLVMDFVRYGWEGAQPRFNVDGFMRQASEFILPNANRRISQPIADRIITCVNACAGLTDDEIKQMREMWDRRRNE